MHAPGRSEFLATSPCVHHLPMCAAGSLRQVSTTNLLARYPRQEIFKCAWGTICRSGFDDADASVVCRELGLGGNGTVISGRSPGTGPIWVSNFDCSGQEALLEQCPNATSTSSCSHSNDVIVRCNGAGALQPSQPTGSSTGGASDSNSTSDGNASSSSSSTAMIGAIAGAVAGVGEYMFAGRAATSACNATRVCNTGMQQFDSLHAGVMLASHGSFPVAYMSTWCCSASGAARLVVCGTSEEGSEP